MASRCTQQTQTRDHDCGVGVGTASFRGAAEDYMGPPASANEKTAARRSYAFCSMRDFYAFHKALNTFLRVRTQRPVRQSVPMRVYGVAGVSTTPRHLCHHPSAPTRRRALHDAALVFPGVPSWSSCRRDTISHDMSRGASTSSPVITAPYCGAAGGGRTGNAKGKPRQQLTRLHRTERALHRRLAEPPAAQPPLSDN